MKKSFWLKLCVIVIAVSMIVSLAACNNKKPEETETSDTPVQSTTAPKDETTEPKDETTAPKDETTAPKDETTAPKDETTAPKDDTTAPKEDTTEPKEDTTEPKDETTEPKDETTEAPHTHAFVTDQKGRTHKCDCGATEDCPSAVGMQKDETQHWYVECTVCSIPGTKTDHNFTLEEAGVSHKCQCGATEACPSGIEKDDEGHWTSACTVCAIEETAKEAHKIELTVTAGDNGSTYSYACACGYSVGKAYSVDASVNFYAAAGEQINNWNGGFNGNGGAASIVNLMVDEEGGFVYNRVFVYNGCSFEITNVVGDRNISKLVDTAKGGAGRYLVFKYRVGAGEPYGQLFGYTTTLDEEGKQVKTYAMDNLAGSGTRNFVDADRDWQVLVIDLSTASGFANYDTTITEDVLVGFGMKFNGSTPEDNTNYIDIAYFAVVDTLEDVTELTGSKKVLVSDWNNAANDTVVNTCEHAYLAVEVVEGVYQYTCGKCKEVIYTIDHDDTINYFVAPTLESAFNNWNAGSFYNASGSYIGFLEYDNEEDIPYVQIDVWGGASFELTNGSSELVKGFGDVAEVTNGKGQYAIIKVRLTEEMTNGFKFSVQDVPQGDTTFLYQHARKNVPVDSWIVYVIDLSKAYEGCYTVAEGESNICITLMNNLGDGGKRYGSIDLAYVAIVDNWTEVAAVVGDEEVVYLEDWVNGEGVVLPSTGPVDEPEDTDPPAETDPVEPPVETDPVEPPVETDPVEVPGINYYVGPSDKIGYNNWNAGPDSISWHESYVGIVDRDEENGVDYARVGLKAGASFELLSENATPVKGFGSLDDVVYGSTGRYIVMKIRLGSGETLLRLLAGDGTSSVSSSDAVFNQNKRTFSAGCGWTVFVIDLEGFSTYTTGVGAETTKVTFGMMGDGDGGENDYVDIAYFAVVDNWAEVAEVAGETQVVYCTNWNDGSTDQILNSDGTPVEAPDDEPEDTDPPAETDPVEPPVEVEINYYSAPGQYYNNWAAGGLGGSCAAIGEIMTDPNGGFEYTHTVMGQGGSFEFTNGSITPARGFGVNGVKGGVLDDGDTIVGGSGTYFVLKIKGTDIDGIQFMMNSTDDEGGSSDSGYSPSGFRTVTDEVNGDWVIYVVKIPTTAQYVPETEAERVCVGLQMDSAPQQISGNETLDIAYFAIVDNWAEVEAVVGNETVSYLEDWGGAIQTLNSDGTPVAAE